MTTITSLTLDVADTTAAGRFYASAFGLDDRLRVRASDAATSGFRGYTISLIVSQPADARLLLDAAIAAGASILKPATKSLWGFGGSVQAPDGAIWKVATTAKKNTQPPSKTVDAIVVLLGVEDVGASKAFYVDHGLTVGKSFGSYVDFEMATSPIRLGLYKRRALAKDAGVAPEGSGSHRMTLETDVAGFTDPDGFSWDPATATANA